MPSVQYAGVSERGPRQLNQDSYFCSPDLGLFLVADGMGGHKAGEVASRLAVDTVVQFITATAKSNEMTWPFSYDPKQSVAANRLSVALRLANRRVFDAGRSDPQLAGMGTTMVAVLVEDGAITIGHVGDSRAYLLRQGSLQQMTRDHTWVAAMLEAEPTARTEDHPMRHVLTSGIGMREDVTPALKELPAQSGDCWMLCSDGVHGYTDEAAMADAMQQESPETAATTAVRSALESGGSDNATAVVLRFV